MLIILFAWLYISLVCLIWGNLFLNIINRSASFPVNYGLPLICMAGLAMVGTLALYLSVFLPLNWKAHAIAVMPSLIYCFSRKNRHTIRMQIAELVKSLSWQAHALLFASVLMVLVISSHSIVHPDTLSYHAQSIQWLQQYKPVPGIMHLRRELGFQSLWFALQAIFTPQITSINTFFPLSGCVLCWYFIFIICRIDGSPVKKANRDASGTTATGGWVLLLLYTLVSWTQVRLTAASTSPDFIVTLYILAAFYSFNQSYQEHSAGYSYLLLTVLFCSSAFATKLSAIAILLLILFIILHFYRNRNWRGIAFCLCLSALMIIPVLIRNIMVTGYPLYPSSFAGFFNADWKFSEARMNEFEQYITTYARLLPPSQTMAGESLQLPFGWINIWWQRLAAADQLLIVAAMAGIILDLIFLKQVIKKAVKQQVVIFLIAIAGTLFWFIKAPDPRFGTGFLISLVYTSYYPLRERIGFLNNKAALYSNKIITGCLFIAIISYTAWRFLNLFEPGQILWPKGIQKVNYRPVDWHHTRFNLTENRNPCGSTPIPCVTDSSLLSMPRGETIDAGFRDR